MGRITLSFCSAVSQRNFVTPTSQLIDLVSKIQLSVNISNSQLIIPMMSVKNSNAISLYS